MEQVLVVKTQLFRECGYFEGFIQALDTRFDPLFLPENQFFVDRDVAERDPELKQLIPYVMLRQFGLVYNYFRGTGQGESRLHGKRSVGFGGHINPADKESDVRPEQQYLNGVLRELCEELSFTAPPKMARLQTLGFVNDDSTDVGRVHLGVVHGLIIPTCVRVTANEKDMLDLEMHTVAALREQREQFETWSQYCLDNTEGCLRLNTIKVPNVQSADAVSR